MKKKISLMLSLMMVFMAVFSLNAFAAENNQELSEIIDTLTETDFIEAAYALEDIPNYSELTIEEKDAFVIDYLVNGAKFRLFYLPVSSGALNAAEKALALKNPWEASQFYVSSQSAINATRNYFGYNGYQDASDAFRHAYWNANLTIRIGESRAKVWTDAHESESSGIDKQMDLFNNALGRSIGRNYSSTDGRVLKEVQDKTYNSIKAGNGRVIKNGKLVSSAF